MSAVKFVYFGGEPLAVPVLEELQAAGLTPSLIVCNPDRPVGRSQELTPPPAKVWAREHGIEVYQPTTYKEEEPRAKLAAEDWDLFVVVAYNFILPKWLLDIPKKGVLNVHPSLLPKLRGASPIRTTIKDDLLEDVGVTVMLMDEEMDHGPILDQAFLPLDEKDWPVSGPELDSALAHLGGELLAETIPAWLAGEIEPQDQDHTQATYCGKLTKQDSRLQINPLHLPTDTDARKAWHAIQAFAGIGDTYFEHNGQRVKIKKAELVSDKLRLLRVTPEGKSEMDFAQYVQSIS